MKVLSFDIGIKNLSYCLLIDKQISDWGIINISCDPPCCRDGCEKSATYIIDNMGYCSSHKNLKECRGKKTKKIKKCDNSLLKIGEKMVSLFDEYSNFLNVDEVIVENQPSLKNPTMKSIQMMVYTYFLVRGVTRQESPIYNIEMINARNKLKIYDGPSIECKLTNKYKKNKYLGIEYCKYMIHNSNQDEKWITLFESSKKKDDLSDAYLQGMYYLNKIKYI